MRVSSFCTVYIFDFIFRWAQKTFFYKLFISPQNYKYCACTWSEHVSYMHKMYKTFKIKYVRCSAIILTKHSTPHTPDNHDVDHETIKFHSKKEYIYLVILIVPFQKKLQNCIHMFHIIIQLKNYGLAKLAYRAIQYPILFSVSFPVYLLYLSAHLVISLFYIVNG